MRYSKDFSIYVLIIFLTHLSGCSVKLLSTTSSPISRLLFSEKTGVNQPTSPKFIKSILVRKVLMRGIVESHSLFFQDSEQKITKIPNHRWIQLPSEAFTYALVRNLRENNVFESVIESDVGVISDLEMSVEISGFGIVSNDEMKASAQIFLFDSKTRKVLFSKYLTVSEKNELPHSMAISIASKIVDQIVKDISEIDYL